MRDDMLKKLDKTLFDRKSEEMPEGYDSQFMAKFKAARDEKARETAFGRLARLAAFNFKFNLAPAMPALATAAIAIMLVSGGIYLYATRPADLVSVSKEGVILLKGTPTSLHTADLVNMNKEELAKAIDETTAELASGEELTPQSKADIERARKTFMKIVLKSKKETHAYRPSRSATTEEILKQAAERSAKMPLENITPVVRAVPMAITPKAAPAAGSASAPAQIVPSVESAMTVTRPGIKEHVGEISDIEEAYPYMVNIYLKNKLYGSTRPEDVLQRREDGSIKKTVLVYDKDNRWFLFGSFEPVSEEALKRAVSKDSTILAKAYDNMTQAEKDRVMALDAGSDEIVAGMQGLIKARSGM